MAFHNLLSAVRIAEPLASCSAIYWQKKNTTNQEKLEMFGFFLQGVCDHASWQNPAFPCCKPLYFTQVVCLFLDLFFFIHMDSWNSLLTSLTFTMRLERCILQTFRHYLFFLITNSLGVPIFFHTSSLHLRFVHCIPLFVGRCTLLLLQVYLCYTTFTSI